MLSQRKCVCVHYCIKCLLLVNLEKQELTYTTATEDAAGRKGGSLFDCCFPSNIFKFVSCVNSTKVAVSSSAQTLCIH